MRLVTRVFAMFVLCVAASCATAGGLRQEPLHSGISRQFEGDFDSVLKAARDAVINAGLAVDSFDQPNATTGVIVAKKGGSAFSWGELVRVVVEGSPGDHQVTVWVKSQRKLATNVSAKGDYSETIFSNIALALK